MPSPLQSTRWSPPATGRRHFLRQVFVWWRGEDSNLRSLRRQIYSLLPLAAREPLQGICLAMSLRVGNRFPIAQWSWRQELNPQPADYKSAALPIELRQHKMCLIYHCQKKCKGNSQKKRHGIPLTIITNIVIYQHATETRYSGCSSTLLGAPHFFACG